MMTQPQNHRIHHHHHHHHEEEEDFTQAARSVVRELIALSSILSQ